MPKVFCNFLNIFKYLEEAPRASAGIAMRPVPNSTAQNAQVPLGSILYKLAWHGRCLDRLPVSVGGNT